MTEVRARAGGSSEAVIKGTSCFADGPQLCVSKNQSSPPQARGLPLEPNPFQATAALISDARITYSSSRRDLRDRECLLAGHNRENKA